MTHQMKKINGVYHVGADAAAEMCGVSTVTFRKWVLDADPPPWNNREGMSPMADLADWIGRVRMFKKGPGGGRPYLPDLSRLQRDGIIAPTAGGAVERDKAIINKAEEDARLTKLRADMAQVDLDEKMGKLVPADQIESEWTLLITRTKTRMLGIPSVAAQEIAGEPSVEIVEQELSRLIQEALEELSKTGRDDDEE